MAFTQQHAFDLLKSAFTQKRLPHALLITGLELSGTHELCRSLVTLVNPGTKAESLDSIKDEYCQIVKPRSKSRRILIEDIRRIEPFLRQKAPLNRWKIVIFIDAERMNEEAANAFLKTLEEPPNHSLIILITEKPEQLLQTILSRCVTINIYSQQQNLKLAPAQKDLLPHLVKASENIGNDLTALSFRSALLNILSSRKDELTKSITQALKEEAKQSSEGTETNLESQNKEINAALIETEYLMERDMAIDLIILWFGQAALISAGKQEINILHDGVATMAKTLKLADIMKRMSAIENMKNDLRFNVHEGLCVDCRMLEAFGV